MVETVKTQAALLAQMADGGNNTAEEVRDNIVSMWTPGWVRQFDHILPGETATSIDEFDDGSDWAGGTPAPWTLVTVSGGQTIREARSLLSIELTSNITSGDLNAILATDAISVGDAVEVFVPGAGAEENFAFGPIITDGTTGAANVAGTLCQIRPSTTNNMRNFYQVDGTLTAIGTPLTEPSVGTLGAGIYMRVEHDATNSYKSTFSFDGVTYFLVGDAAHTVTLTPTHVGFGWQNAALGFDVASVAIDYVRTVTV